MRHRTHLARLISLRGRPVVRSLGLAALVVAAALALAACGGSSGPHVASLPASTAPASTAPASTAPASTAPASTAGSTTSPARATTNKHGSSSTTRSAKGNPTRLLDEWTTCMQRHGDPDQAAPTVDAYGVIHVTIASGASETLSGEIHAGADPCNHYMAAAQAALRAANPVGSPPDQAEQIKYVNCLRANGYPTFPYPQGNQANFNGTGIDPTSPAFLNGRANQKCGKQIGAPSWWTNGTGQPGDVTVGSGPNGGPPPGATPVRPGG